MARTDDSRGGFWQRWLGSRPAPPPTRTARRGVAGVPAGPLQRRREDPGGAACARRSARSRFTRRRAGAGRSGRALPRAGALRRGRAAVPARHRDGRALQGPEHRSLARKLNSLALVYRAQGQYDAGRAALPARAGDRRAARTAPSTRASPPCVANLLTVYLAQGRYHEARPLFRARWRSRSAARPRASRTSPAASATTPRFCARPRAKPRRRLIEARAEAIRARRAFRAAAPGARSRRP